MSNWFLETKGVEEAKEEEKLVEQKKQVVQCKNEHFHIHPRSA